MSFGGNDLSHRMMGMSLEQIDKFAGVVADRTRECDTVIADLHGSHARGVATPRSDLDVAVLLDRTPRSRPCARSCC